MLDIRIFKIGVFGDELRNNLLILSRGCQMAFLNVQDWATFDASSHCRTSKFSDNGGPEHGI